MQFLDLFVGVAVGALVSRLAYKAGQHDTEDRLDCVARSLQNIETELAMKRDRLTEFEGRLLYREEEIRRQDKKSWDGE